MGPFAVRTTAVTIWLEASLTVPSFSPLVIATDLPYAQAATARSSADQILRPAHLPVIGALFLVILYETGRPHPCGGAHRHERVRDDRGGACRRALRPLLRLLKWGSACKQLILYTILIDVFIAPWGLSSTSEAASVGLAVLALLGKAVLLGCVVAVIDDSFAKLRLFKIIEFVAAACCCC